MKRAPLFTALCALALALTACGSRTNGATNGFGGSGSGSFRNATLTPDAKLALGTIKLEGSAQAVDPATAAKLIPLWQLMVQLHSSSSTAPQEVTAVVDQIRATMAPAQLSQIDGMSLSAADIFSLLQSEAQAGGAAGGTGGSGSNGFGGRNNRQGDGGRVFFVGPGGFAGGPGGGFGGGFGGGGARTTTGNGSTSTSQLTPAEQAQALQARENATSTLVENQLIRLLEIKLHSQPG